MGITAGYKQTEFGLFPFEWDLKPFKEISFMKGRIGWQGLKQTEFTMNADQPFLITGMNFKDGEIRWDEVYHVPYERYDIAKEIQLKISDVLMTKDGTIGKLLFVDNIPSPGYATLNSHLLVFRPTRNSYIPKFLYYQLTSKFFKNFIDLNKSGTTFFGISQQSVGEYSVFLPTIKEQTAIATALSDADVLIASLEKLIEKKRAIKQGAMQELLTPKEGWATKKIGEIAEVRDGTHQTPKYVESGMPFYSVETVTNNSFTNTKFISEKEHAFLTKNFRVEKGDILMTRIGSIGDCKLIDWDVNASFYVSLALLKIKSGLSASFLYHYSKTSAFKNEIELNSLQSAIPRKINLGPISNIKIHLPNIEEQIRIANILSEMEAEIFTLEQKLSKFKYIKQGMMQELLTGKIRLV